MFFYFILFGPDSVSPLSFSKELSHDDTCIEIE